MLTNTFRTFANGIRTTWNNIAFFGRGATTFADGAIRNRNRNKSNSVIPKDIMEELPSFSRRELVQFSRYLDMNQSYVSGMYSDIVNYVIRNGFTPEFHGGDPEWQKKAKMLFLEWAKNPTPGGRNDLTAELKVIVRAWLRDGEVFPLFTFKADGTPCIQTLETHVFSDSYLMGGVVKTVNLTEYLDGIKYDSGGAAIGYMTYTGEPVEASAILHVGEPTRANQIRYYPPITPAINNAFDAKELDGLAKQGFKLQLAIPMLIQRANEGGNAPKAKTFGSQSAPTSDDTDSQQFEDATGASVLNLPMGSKVDMHRPEYPGPLYTVFKETLSRDLCVACQWSYDFLVTTNLGGTPQRAAIEKTKARAEVIQDTIAWPVYRRAMLHWLAWAIETKQLEPVDNWWSVTYRKPRDMSIDLGRDTRALLDEVGRLLMSPDEYFALYSQTPEEEFAKGAAALKITPDEYRKLFILKNYGPEALTVLEPNANSLQQGA